MSAFSPDDLETQFIGLGSLVMGSIATVLGVMLGVYKKKLWSQGKRTVGTVTSLGEFKDLHGKTSYRPIVTFKTEDGTEQSWQSSVGVNYPQYAIGKQVPMVYDPGNPKSASIATFAEVFAGPMVFGLVGLFFVFLGWKMAPHDLAGVKAALGFVFLGK